MQCDTRERFHKPLKLSTMKNWVGLPFERKRALLADGSDPNVRQAKHLTWVVFRSTVDEYFHMYTDVKLLCGVLAENTTDKIIKAMPVEMWGPLKIIKIASFYVRPL